MGPLALIDLGIEGVLALSRKPLRWFSLLSLMIFIATTVFIIQQMSVNTVNAHHVIMGIAAFITVGIAMIGEYLGATLSEVRQRPIYLLDNLLGEAPERPEHPCPIHPREQENH